jgi:Tol biopolymer transport system component
MSQTERLTSWKEISAYLGCDARTAQRWEKAEGLPVHRHQHAKLSSVYAFPAELDAWRERRSPANDLPVALATEPPVRRRRHLYVYGGLAFALAAGVVLWHWIGRRPHSNEARLPAPLTSWFGSQTAATFSPDGAQVAFTWDGEGRDNFDIYAMTIGSSHPLRLTTDPADDYSPAWSPDGKWIAFMRSQPGQAADLMLMPALGGTARVLTRTRSGPGPFSRNISWSPDGRWIATIALAPESGANEISLVSTTNGEIRPLTDPPPGQADVNPSFSPDGSTLVFVRAFGNSSSIFLMPVRSNMTAGKPEMLALTGFEKALNGAPVWTPDGRDLIFVSSFEGLYRLWRVPRAGGSPRLVAGLGERLTHPQLSLKGRRLAFTRRVYDTNIWAMDLPVGKNSHAGQPVQIIASTFTESDPQYSPNGEQIVFVSARSGYTEIWIADRNGKNSVQLTNLRAVTGAPRWSPDGKELIFDSTFEGRPQLYSLPAEGGTPRRLSKAEGVSGLPHWSPDGAWLYFTSHYEGNVELWRTSAKTGAGEQVSHGGAWRSALSQSGRFLYYTRRFTNLGEYTVLVEMHADSEGKFGSSRVLAGSVCDRCFAVAPDGVYAFQFAGTRKQWELYWYPAGDSNGVLIATLTHPVFGGMTVSPDGRRLIFAQVDQDNRNLMLVENYR